MLLWPRALVSATFALKNAKNRHFGDKNVQKLRRWSNKKEKERRRREREETSTRFARAPPVATMWSFDLRTVLFIFTAKVTCSRRVSGQTPLFQAGAANAWPLCQGDIFWSPFGQGSCFCAAAARGLAPNPISVSSLLLRQLFSFCRTSVQLLPFSYYPSVEHLFSWQTIPWCFCRRILQRCFSFLFVNIHK